MAIHDHFKSKKKKAAMKKEAAMKPGDKKSDNDNPFKKKKNPFKKK